METATPNAVIEWPEGNEYLSGGRMADQQCGSISHGLLRRLVRLSARNKKIPATAAEPAAPIAAKRCSPPYTSRIKPRPYQSHPSPPRVATIIKMRNHRGARQL